MTNLVDVDATKNINVATRSSNGHFINSEAVQVDGLEESFVIKAKVGQEVQMKSKNHGNLSVTKEAGKSLVVFHQDDVDELGQTIRARLD